MKIQCERCKEIVAIGEFEMADGGIHVTCAACTETFFVASGGSAQSRPEPEPEPKPEPEPEPKAEADGGPRMTCPKCETEQAEGDACRSCGLLRAKFSSFEGSGAGASAALEAAWSACEDDWANDDAHNRLLERVASERAFAWGARRYRRVLRDRPDDSIAETRLDKLARMAEAEMLSLAVARNADETAKEPYKGVVVVMLVLLLVAGGGGIYFMYKRSQQATKAPSQYHGPGTPSTFGPRPLGPRPGNRPSMLPPPPKPKPKPTPAKPAAETPPSAPSP